MTKSEKEKIKDNLRAFTANFGDVRIEEDGYRKGFYVYSPADAETYVQYCYNADYLNGWLYGCVQGYHNIVRPSKPTSEEIHKSCVKSMGFDPEESAGYWGD